MLSTLASSDPPTCLPASPHTGAVSRTSATPTVARASANPMTPTPRSTAPTSFAASTRPRRGTRVNVVSAVRVVARGDAKLSPSVTRALIERFAATAQDGRRAAALARLDPLTEREGEVLVAVGRGLSNAEVGRALFLSEATVKTHVSRLLLKLGCANRVQVAILAHDAGLLDPVLTRSRPAGRSGQVTRPAAGRRPVRPCRRPRRPGPRRPPRGRPPGRRRSAR